MKRLLILALTCLALLSCDRQRESIDGGLQQLLADFYDRNDFTGALWEEDSCVWEITTCLSVMLYDYEDIHYMTLFCFELPIDCLSESTSPGIFHHPTCYYPLDGKDVFVFNHTKHKNTALFRFSKQSVAEGKAMEQRYNAKSIDYISDDARNETYRYNVAHGKVSFERDTSFCPFAWAIECQ